MSSSARASVTAADLKDLIPSTIGAYPMLQSSLLFLIVAPCALPIAVAAHGFLEVPANQIGRWIAQRIVPNSGGPGTIGFDGCVTAPVAD
jgi:hypothetical protein